ncbi:hypothetical protein WJX72_008440 [[Myrmecia] bisecta]|uniref:NB-ARC domain-containing protein n=1 Tax=[Myrmecia] bisecta TaxID=41462 RepID=A0AAW1QRQ2_9CHLO
MHPRSDVGTSSSRKYDVFVSHRGPDTKRNFVELLLDKLRGREVFVDKWGLEPGVFNWDTIKAALRWLEALECTAKIVGWRYDNENESLLDLVNDVFKDLESNLPPQPLDRHSRDKVGVAERVEAILGRPGMQKAASVRVLGLWGMGGIGKTTLAVALFDKLTSDFAPATCFVAEVRSHMEGDGPTKLQHQMLKELWDRTAERPPNILQGQNSLKDKLNKKRGHPGITEQSGF